MLGRDQTHPCLSCNNQFCLDQKLPSCKGASLGSGIDMDVGTGYEGDVSAKCFVSGHLLGLGSRTYPSLAPFVQSLTLSRHTHSLHLLQKRDSPRDHIIVFCFIVLVVGLLGVAFIRCKLEKAGWDPRKFTEGGFWKVSHSGLLTLCPTFG